MVTWFQCPHCGARIPGLPCTLCSFTAKKRPTDEKTDDGKTVDQLNGLVTEAILAAERIPVDARPFERMAAWSAVATLEGELANALPPGLERDIARRGVVTALEEAGLPRFASACVQAGLFRAP